MVAVAPLEVLPYGWWRKDAIFRATSLAAPPSQSIVLYEEWEKKKIKASASSNSILRLIHDWWHIRW
jgi:hypothetical protein